MKLTTKEFQIFCKLIGGLFHYNMYMALKERGEFIPITTRYETKQMILHSFDMGIHDWCTLPFDVYKDGYLYRSNSGSILNVHKEKDMFSLWIAPSGNQNGFYEIVKLVKESDLTHLEHFGKERTRLIESGTSINFLEEERKKWIEKKEKENQIAQVAIDYVNSETNDFWINSGAYQSVPENFTSHCFNLPLMKTFLNRKVRVNKLKGKVYCWKECIKKFIDKHTPCSYQELINEAEYSDIGIAVAQHLKQVIVWDVLFLNNLKMFKDKIINHRLNDE